MSPNLPDPDPPLDPYAVVHPSATAVEVLTAGGNDRWLTDLQLQVIDLIVAGVHITTIAKTLDVGRTTIYEWRKRPAFAAEESRRREFMRVERGDAALALLDLAGGVIRTALAHGDTTVAVRVLRSFGPTALLHAAGDVKTLGQMVEAEAARRCVEAEQTVADDVRGLELSLRRNLSAARTRTQVEQVVANENVASATATLDPPAVDAADAALGSRRPPRRGRTPRRRNRPGDDGQLTLFPTNEASDLAARGSRVAS